jgi:tRNA G10  N-methylase Trm11
VEAALLCRRCIGVELEERWVALAQANLERAAGSELSPAGLPSVLRGDARVLPDLLGEQTGRVDLILVSPPYGCDTGVIKWQDRGTEGDVCRPESLNYSTDRANLGHARGAVYDKAMLEVYAACHIALRDGG